MFLGRIIRATGCGSYSMIRPKWLTKIFVMGDVVCFLIQALGAGILSNADDKKKRDLGQNIILVGLVMQIVIFGLFMIVAMVFHLRVRKRSAGKTIFCKFNWQRYMFMLYTTSIIITVRNLFRVIEYAMGGELTYPLLGNFIGCWFANFERVEKGYLLSHEWPIYVFDAALMAVALAVCAMWYLGSNAFESVDQDVEMMISSNQDN
jgi:hypothetical protein